MQPITERRWRMSEADPAVVESLAREARVSPILARVMAGRGIATPSLVAAFLQPGLGELADPFLLSGLAPAVDRLLQARAAGERVCIYGDYDVDGITAVALLQTFFQTVGMDACYHIPLRRDEGYGLSRDGIDAAVRLGARVIVTVDCGITAVSEATYCREQGVDLIITDHHTPGDPLPAACAVINPHQPGCATPFKQLAGVGVAFKLLIGLRARLRETGAFATAQEPNLREYLDLVALGTVADLVPLNGENRALVAHGLRELSAARRLGIRALKKVAAVADPVTCGAVGFRLAPRLNAAGRLDDAALGVELLLCRDPDRAAELAEMLDAGNRERQELEQAILKDALARVEADPAMADRTSIVLASPDWHPGVIGIVASRLVDRFHRPTILIALQDGVGKGSGRSIPAFHLHDALKDCAGQLEKFGGHRQAAGLAVAEETLAAFVARFDEVAAGLLEPADLMPVLSLDGELSPADITTELAGQLSQLAPFGMGNPEPVLLVRGMTVTGVRELNGGHLRLTVSRDGRSFTAIGFSLAGRVAPGEQLDLACTPQLNEWRGTTSLQLKIRDLRPA
ncbi:MAG TPA: single-stranded-DNA-specific exonuclease RecJ [Geobacteraceae bacterium]